MVFVIIGHVGSVYSLTVLKGAGKVRLFSASYDKTIRVSFLLALYKLFLDSIT